MLAFLTIIPASSACSGRSILCSVDSKRATALAAARRSRRVAPPLYVEATAAQNRLHKAEYGNSTEHGRLGLYATQNLSTDEVIASVTAGAAFPGVDQSAQTDGLRVTASTAFPEAAAEVALQLLLETVRKETSPWNAYVENVCKNRGMYRDHPLVWDDVILSAFSGTELEARQTALREGLLIWLEDRRATMSEDFLCSKQAFLRAVALVLDRGVWLADAKRWVLAPPLDELRPTLVEPASVYFQCSRRGLFGGKMEIQALCRTAVNKGSELCRRSDAGDEIEFFLYHGFLEKSVAEQTRLGSVEHIGPVTLSFEISHLDRFYDDKIDVLEMNFAGVHGDDTDIRRGSFLISATDLSLEALRADTNPVNEMIQFLRLLCLSGSDAFLLEGLFRSEVWGFMALPVSEQNERMVCELVLAVCEERLQALDAATLPESDIISAELQRTARICRNAERSTFQEIMTYFRNEVNALREKEYYHERRLRALDLYRPLDPDEIHDADATGFDQYI